jgi:hypothetical protein
MSDPTYVRAEIDSNPEWKLAWRLSEVDNDNAPVGWGRYIILARWLLATYDLTERSGLTFTTQIGEEINTMPRGSTRGEPG